VDILHELNFKYVGKLIYDETQGVNTVEGGYATTVIVFIGFFAIPGICFNACIFCSTGDLEPTAFFGGISFVCTRICYTIFMLLFLFSYLSDVKSANEANFMILEEFESKYDPSCMDQYSIMDTELAIETI
jgi:hypothetical protein